MAKLSTAPGAAILVLCLVLCASSAYGRSLLEAKPGRPIRFTSNAQGQVKNLKSRFGDIGNTIKEDLYAQFKRDLFQQELTGYVEDVVATTREAVSGQDIGIDLETFADDFKLRLQKDVDEKVSSMFEQVDTTLGKFDSDEIRKNIFASMPGMEDSQKFAEEARKKVRDIIDTTVGKDFGTSIKQSVWAQVTDAIGNANDQKPTFDPKVVIENVKQQVTKATGYNF